VCERERECVCVCVCERERLTHVREEFAQSIEDLVKVAKDGRAGHLGDVVERLCGVVAHAALGVVCIGGSAGRVCVGV